MPHDFTTRRRLETGDVVACWLVAYDGYWVENIRTTVVGGKPSDEQRRIFDAVREAHDRGMNAVRPGTPASAYEAVRSTRPSRPGGRIHHRAYYGMGLGYHEPPFVGPSDQTVLEPGAILTIEPGVFYSGMGGITLSDTLLVTDDGHEVLTHSSRSEVAVDRRGDRDSDRCRCGVWRHREAGPSRSRLAPGDCHCVSAG